MPMVGVLSEPETAALWELSLNQNKPISLRFLDQAARNPIALRQLRGRSEPALIAAIGLDTGRRERASRLLGEQTPRPTELSPQDKAEVGFVALELDDQAAPASEEYARVIVQAMAADHVENLQDLLEKPSN